MNYCQILQLFTVVNVDEVAAAADDDDDDDVQESDSKDWSDRVRRFWVRQPATDVKRRLRLVQHLCRYFCLRNWVSLIKHKAHSM